MYLVLLFLYAVQHLEYRLSIILIILFIILNFYFTYSIANLVDLIFVLKDTIQIFIIQLKVIHIASLVYDDFFNHFFVQIVMLLSGINYRIIEITI